MPGEPQTVRMQDERSLILGTSTVSAGSGRPLACAPEWPVKHRTGPTVLTVAPPAPSVFSCVSSYLAVQPCARDPPTGVCDCLHLLLLWLCTCWFFLWGPTLPHPNLDLFSKLFHSQSLVENTLLPVHHLSLSPADSLGCLSLCCWGADLWIWGCLAASLASAH